MSAQEILKMIEEVDPADTAKLDEIDARVWCYADCSYYGRLEPVQFVEYGKQPPRLIEEDSKEYYAENPNHVPVGFVFKYAFMSCWWKPEGEQGPIDYKEQFFTISKRYTRSRDALKAIRPEGWNLEIEVWGKPKARCTIWKRPFCDTGIRFSRWLPTEELAELHCIIKAIEHERTKGETK